MKIKFLFFLLAAVYFIGCTPSVPIYYEVPIEFKDDDKFQKFIDAHKPYLTGKKIFLDPGHGGEDRRNKGAKGLAIEADVNLRVGLFLREFLSQAGVEVIMSRDKDTTVDLKERSYMANRTGADFFLSIHHNAPGQEGDNWTNYTSTYYHAKESDYEHEPSERDIARFIQRDLSYAMRNSGGLGSFDGTYSDYNIYPGAGFSVLRVTEIPSVLVECGFHTHHFEEERLALEEFNKIQAWGIFRGLSRYYKIGAPQIEYQSIEKFGADFEISFALADTNGIDTRSIRVFVDSTESEDFLFDKKSNTLAIRIHAADEVVVRIIAANKMGIHALPFHRKYVLKEEN